MARKRRKKPTRAQITMAIAKAVNFTDSCRGREDHNGQIVDEILDPLLWDYYRLRGLLVDFVETWTDGFQESPLLDRIRKALKESSPILD